MNTALACLLLFGCGTIMHLALTQGFYANATLAGLVGAWVAASLGWLQTRHAQPVAAIAPRPTAPNPAGLRLRSMLDQVPVPLLLLSPDGLLRVQNRAARALFNTDDRVLADLPQLRAALLVLQPGERSVVALPSARATQPDRMFALTVAHSTAVDGPTRLVVLTDIQAELQAAEASALRDLLGVLSHEIMNSLTPVTSLAESACALLDEDTEAARVAAIDALETIGRRAGSLNRFVTGYRLLARLPPPTLRTISLSTLLRDATTFFRAGPIGRDLTVILGLPDTEIMLRCDPDLIMQAIVNLLTNAAEAALAADASPNWIAISGRVEDCRAVVRISDSGAGIPQGDEEIIFRPFFTSKPAGTGLGLGLARQIACSHGGSLTLEPPDADRGAMFRLEI